MESYEKLGSFYLGRRHDLESGETGSELTLYDSKDLVTHAVCVGMTGSGKTGLCVGLLEEAAIDDIPALVIDPKGDLSNLLLTFPDLAPSDFRPWINEDEARRKGKTADQFAASQAELWRKGLASWDQGPERIQRLRDAADFRVYTPGSEAGHPVSILSSFAAPPAALMEDSDLLRERVSTTATSLLGLLGVDADPIRSREHILLATLFDRAWREGRSLDLAALIQEIQSPPVTRIGVLELESFFSSRDRFALAMQLNNLLAAPGFATWMTGEPLDVDKLLYTDSGKPRIAIFSIAHLSEPERMFFVSLLLNQTLGWMRGRPGTTSLRALLYMDEIFGYMPPVAEPPSKRPLLTMLKQARAYGLGVVLATQNPVDLDYKGLSNTGTWFIGRLQTERDKMRVLEGLEGATAGGEFDRGKMERTLAGLGKRVFLMHNVHDNGPTIFHTRWVMSYLCGPLTRNQIKSLVDKDSGGDEARDPAAQAPAGSPSSAASRPVLAPGIPQAFLPARGAGAVTYEPSVLGIARIQYVDRKSKELVSTEELALLAPLDERSSDVDWQDATDIDIAEDDLDSEPVRGASFSGVPAAAGDPRSYRRWEKDLSNTLYRGRSFDLLKSPTLGVVATAGESERDFRIRLGDSAREARDEAVEKLRKKYATRMKRLEESIRKAEQVVDREKEQASQQKLNTAISIGASLLAAFTGGRSFRGATTAARGFTRSAKESGDIRRAEDTVEAKTEELEAFNEELQREVEDLKERFDPSLEELETVSLRPRRSDIEVRRVALGWQPR